MGKINSKIVTILLIFTTMTIVIVSLAVVGFTSPLEDLQHDIDSQREQSENIADKLESINEQKKKTEKTVEQNKAELQRIREEMDNELTEREKAIDELQAMRKTIEELDETIEKIQKEYDEKVALFLERARLMYRYSDYSTLEIIMESENILDFNARANLFTHMLEYDKDLLNEIASEKAELDSKKEYQKSIESDQETILNEIQKTIAYLESSEENTLEKYNGGLSQIASLKAQQEKLEKDEKELQERIAKLMAESKNYKYDGGKMLWPLNSWVRISDTFRFREVHPVTGEAVWHNGIDISAYAGTPILAAAGGTVIDTGYNSSAGNYVIIDHGGGVNTLYCHASKILTSIGAQVKRGQQIALVGSTGNSTGAHLHFEVDVKGVPVNPMGYLDVPKK